MKGKAPLLAATGRSERLTSLGHRRLLWIVNHKTLMPAEVPILRSLGWEVFVPKVIPDHDPGFRSAAVTWEYDAALDLPRATLAVLNRHNFYERDWAPTVEDIINTRFDAVVTHFSYYVTALSEAARKFHGTVVARAFGREHPRRYTEFAEMAVRPGVMAELMALGDRFVFGQGYANLAEIEDAPLPQRARTITVPLPDWLYRHRGTWQGGGAKAIFLCPSIAPGNYYSGVYEGIKRDFGDLPHAIFGRQAMPVDDPAILPYLTDDELLALFRSAPVFVYPSDEPRHIHYSPLEAIIVGTPVLYRRGALTDAIAGAPLPGACADTAEMHEKARRLLGGDRDLAEAIRASQGRILDAFAPDLAREQWAAALA
jgi:hypothetical protein